MVRIRKAIAYRHIERPNTRFSKYKKLSYVRSRPVCKVVRFDMGELNKKFPYSLHLLSKTDLQIRDNSLEAARQQSNRTLEKVLGKNGYIMQTRVYPHHVLRENPLASGAGADRLSTGMAHNFGKSIGIAAQVRAGTPVFSVHVPKENIALARKALKQASYKLPCSCRIVQEQNNIVKK